MAGLFGGFSGFGGEGIGRALVRIGADYSGLRGGARQAVAQLRTELNAGLRNVGTGQLGGLNRELDTAVRNGQRLGNQMDVVATKGRAMGLAVKAALLGLGAAAVGGIGMAIKSAIDFENSFAGVEKTVQATEAEIATLRNEFRQLAKEIPVSVNELNRIGEAAGALGIPTQNIIEFTRVVSMIGTTTNVSSDEAATALGQLSNVLGLAQEDYSRFAATLVDLGNKGASTEKQILEMASRSGGAGKLIGLTTAEILAMSSATANLGIEVEAGGSSLQKFYMMLNKLVGGTGGLDEIARQAGVTADQIVTLAERSDEASEQAFAQIADSAAMTTEQLKKLVKGTTDWHAVSRQLGIDQQQFSAAFSERPAQAIVMLLDALNKLDSAGRQRALEALGLDDIRITRMLLGMADNVGVVTNALGVSNTAWEENTAAIREAEKRYKTTTSQLQLMQNTFNDIFITIGQEFLPRLVTMFAFLTDAIPRVFSALGDIWKNILEQPLTRLWEALGRIVGTLSDILLNWGPGGEGQSVYGIFEMIAKAVGFFADNLAKAFDILNQFLSTPVGQGLAKIAAAFTGLALSVRVLTGLRNLLGGIGRGALNTLTLGRLGGATDATAARTQLSAAEMQMRAAQLNMNAVTRPKAPPLFSSQAQAVEMFSRGIGARATPGGPMVLPVSRNFPGGAMPNFGTPPLAPPVNAIPFGPAGTFRADPRRWPQSVVRGGLLAVGTADRAMSIHAQRQYQIASAGLVRAASLRLADGVRSAATGIRNFGGMALAGIGRLFWPLFIADLVGNLLAEPIGNMVADAMGRSGLRRSFQQGWIGGILDTARAAMGESDVFMGRGGPYAVTQRRDAAGELIETSRLSGETLNLLLDATRENEQLLTNIDRGGFVGQQANLRLMQQLLGIVPNIIGPRENLPGWVEPFTKSLQGGLAGQTTPGAEALRQMNLGTGLRQLAAEMGLDANVDWANRQAVDALRDRVLAELRKRIAEGQQAINDAFLQASEAAGVGIKPWEVPSDDVQARLFSLFTGTAGGGASGMAMRWYARQLVPGWSGADVVGADATRTATDAVTQNTTALRDNLQQFNDWYGQLRVKEPELVAFGETLGRAFGEAYETWDALTRERQRAILEAFDVGGVFGDLSDPQAFDAASREFLSSVGQSLSAVGYERRVELANAVRDIVTQGLQDGLSLPQIKSLLGDLWYEMFDGIGYRDTDIQQRVGDAVRNSLLPGIRGAFTDEDKRAVLDQFYSLLDFGGDIPGLTTIPGLREGDISRQWNEFKSAFLSRYKDRLMAAVGPEAKEELFNEVRGIFPDIQTWDDFIALMMPSFRPEAIAAIQDPSKQQGFVRMLESLLSAGQTLDWETANRGVMSFLGPALWDRIGKRRPGMTGEGIIPPMFTGTGEATDERRFAARYREGGAVPAVMGDEQQVETGVTTWFDTLTAWVQQELLGWPSRIHAGGVRAGERILDSIGQGIGQRSLAPALNRSLSNLRSYLPQSPVQRGPLRHPYLLNAGRNIVGQITEGMQRARLALPALSNLPNARFAAPHMPAYASAPVGRIGGLARGAVAPAAAGGAPDLTFQRALQQTIHVDEMTVLGPHDEFSLLQQFQFMTGGVR